MDTIPSPGPVERANTQASDERTARSATDADARVALAAHVKDVVTILALLCAAALFASNGEAAMAGSALGGALTLAMPARATGSGPVRIPPLAAGLALGGLVGALAGA